MPSATTIVLADSVPANHNFDPVQIDPENSLFLERDTPSTSGGFWGLRLTFSRANSGRPTDRVGVRLDVPYEQTVDGIVQIADTARFQGSFTLPTTMTATNRADFAALVKNALAHADVLGYIEDLEPVY